MAEKEISNWTIVIVAIISKFFKVTSSLSSGVLVICPYHIAYKRYLKYKDFWK